MTTESAEPNFHPKTIWTGDNLDIMRGMNSDSVDLIYLDPPFNSKANYAAPIGSKAAGAAFKDTWGLDDVKLVWHGEIKHEYPGLYSLLTATRDIHGASMMSYLIYMAIRVMEMRRLLKSDGSIYLHCDPTASHYLKLLMDAVFSKANFRNEIVWNKGYRGTPRKRRYQQEHDTVLFYAGDGYTWNRQHVPYQDASMSRYNKVDKDGNRYALIKRKKGDGTVYYGKSYPKGKQIGDVVHIPTMASTSKERTGYPTQKPLALLHRVIKASSNEGGMVLDPFCGCATTCIAAEQLGRRWVGIDISAKAAELIQSRMKDELGLLYQGAHRSDIPKRTDLGKVPRYNSAGNKRQLYGIQSGYCNGCGTHFELQHLQVDHIVPKAKGGHGHIANLQLLCGSCNAIKGTRPHEELLLMLTDKGFMRRRSRRMAS